MKKTIILSKSEILIIFVSNQIYNKRNIKKKVEEILDSTVSYTHISLSINSLIDKKIMKQIKNENKRSKFVSLTKEGSNLRKSMINIYSKNNLLSQRDMKIIGGSNEKEQK